MNGTGLWRVRTRVLLSLGMLLAVFLPGAACDISNFTVNDDGAATITVIAGLHYYMELTAGTLSGDCCSAVRWGIGDLSSLTCVDQDDVCPPYGRVWSAWKDVPDTPGTYTVNVGLYGENDCGGDPLDTRTRTLIVVQGDVDVTLEASATSLCEGEEATLTATVQSLVTDPYFHGIDEDPYVASSYASASQVIGWVTFYADSSELGSVRIYGSGGSGSVSLDTTLPVGSPEVTAEYVCDYAYHADTTSSGVTVTVDEDTSAPTFSSFTVTPDDGVLDGSGEESVSYSVTVSDDCCLDPDDITITPSATNGSVKDLVVDKSPASGATTEVIVSGTFTVYGVTGCPAVPSVEVEATDGAANTAATSQSGSGIEDTTDPVVSAFTVTNDSSELDADGEATGSYGLTVSDNSCIQPSAITIDGSATNASLEILTVTKTPASGTTQEVEISGTYRVYDVTGCPVTPTIEVTATDCCGNEATDSADGANITDTIDPAISGLTVTPGDGELDGAGEESVSFAFTVTDNACVDPSNVTVEVTVTGGGHKDLVVNKSPSSGTTTEISVSGTFTVFDLTGCTAVPQVAVSVTDCCENGANDFETGTDISDVTRPTISDLTVGPDDGVVDGDCEETVSFSATVRDNNGLDPADITITPSATNASVKGLTVTKSPSSGTANEVAVSGTFVVYGLTGGTAIPTVQVSCSDLCGWTRVASEDGAGIVDETSPTVTDSSIGPADGQVDGDCEEVITYSFTVADNCCIDPTNVSVTPDTSSSYSVKDHSAERLPSEGATTEVVISGSFTIYDLTGCPVTPSVTLHAVDCSGNEISEPFSGSSVTDSIAPTFSEMSVDPSDGSVDANCEETVSYSVTVTDNCCIDPGNITVTPSATDASVKDLIVNRSPSSGPAKEVVVSGTFTVYNPSACPVTPSIEVEAIDCCGNDATTSQSGGSITDSTPPTLTNLSVAPDDGVVDSNCEEIVQYSVTVSDACCIDTSTVKVTPSVTNGSVRETSVSVDPTGAHAQVTNPEQKAYVIHGSFVVYDLTGCPAIPSIDVEVEDCCGNLATASGSGPAIVDNDRPVIAGLDLPDGMLYVSEDCCSITIPYSATVTDNCCVDGDSGTARVDVLPSPDAAATECDAPNLADNGDGSWTLSGEFTVSCLMACPVEVRLTLGAADCCGNEATEVSDVVTIRDETSPEPVTDPNGYETSRADALEVRIDDASTYRLMVRQDTPIYMDVLANDDDNCDSCGCCGTLWVSEIVDEPEYGTAAVAEDEGDCRGGSSIRYAPDLGYVGPDEFTYTLRDVCGNLSEVAKVTIYVVRELSADDVYVTTCAGEMVAFEVMASDLFIDPVDPSQAEFSFVLVDGPEHGVLTGDLAMVTVTGPSEVEDPMTGEIVPSIDFAESASVFMEYTPAEGFVGRDRIAMGFTDPYGGASLIEVDIVVIDCDGSVEVPAIRMAADEPLVLLMPTSFADVAETAWGTVTLMADGVSYETAMTFRRSGSTGRYMLMIDAAGLPPGTYELTIPLGNGETVNIVLGVE